MPFATARAEPVQLRGTHIVIDPPEGFIESPDFIGLAWEAASATIFATEMPVKSFAAMRDRFKNDPSALFERNIELNRVEDVVIDGHPAIFSRGRQQVSAQTLEKWVLLIGAPQATVLLSGQMPSLTATPARSAQMQAALASVTVADERRDPLDALPFTFDETDRFRLGRVLSVYAVALTDSHLVENPAERALFVIGAGKGEDCSLWAEIGKEAFAEKLISNLRSVQDLEPLTTTPATIGGNAALRTETHGQVNGGRALVIQTVRFQGCRYARTIGIAPAVDEALYRAEFQTLTESVEWREIPPDAADPTPKK